MVFTVVKKFAKTKNSLQNRTWAARENPGTETKEGGGFKEGPTSSPGPTKASPTNPDPDQEQREAELGFCEEDVTRSGKFRVFGPYSTIPGRM